MTRQPQIMYINSYISGSMAYKMEPAPVRKRRSVSVSKTRKAKRRVVGIDPVTIGGVLVSMVLLVLMVVGFARVQNVRNEIDVLKHYIASLEVQNQQLEQEYRDGYDLEEIQNIALAMGMVPAQQVEKIPVSVVEPEPVQTYQMSVWDSFFTFLTGLFA